MRSSYIDLLGCFTLDTCTSVPTTWSMSAMQQLLIAPMNIPQPC